MSAKDAVITATAPVAIAVRKGEALSARLCAASAVLTACLCTAGTQDASGEGDQADIEEGWDSELEEQAVAAIFGTKKRKRKEKVAEPEAEQHVEQAHFGMQSKKDVTGLSLAEQEALALKLLRT